MTEEVTGAPVSSTESAANPTDYQMARRHLQEYLTYRLTAARAGLEIARLERERTLWREERVDELVAGGKSKSAALMDVRRDAPYIKRCEEIEEAICKWEESFAYAEYNRLTGALLLSASEAQSHRINTVTELQVLGKTIEARIRQIAEHDLAPYRE